VIEAVIFDLDGVLIDSVASTYRVKTKALKAYGVDIDVVPDRHGERHKAASLKGLLQAVEKHTGRVIPMTEFSQ